MKAAPVKTAKPQRRCLRFREKTGLGSQKKGTETPPAAREKRRADWKQDLQTYGEGPKLQKRPALVMGQKPHGKSQLTTKIDMYDRPKNLRGLRDIKTARTLTAINSAVDSGFNPLVKPVIPNPEVHNMVAVYQHRTTKKIELVGDCRTHMAKEYDCVIPFQNYYQYSFPSPFAAYLLPPDLKTGEQVWLDDIIEDIVAVWGNQGYHPRLQCGEATWNGKDLVVTFDPARDAQRLIG